MSNDSVFFLFKGALSFSLGFAIGYAIVQVAFYFLGGPGRES